MKLTAEQVRKAIFNGSAYASYDGAKYYADGINMQAIADELNARAERTCKIYRVGITQDLRKCSACDALMNFSHPLDRSHLNYCPNCGAKVVSE